MTTVKQFAFNPFQVNTYILSDSTGECAIIDPGMNDPLEEEEFSSYIKAQGLKPVLLLNTHTHIDHIAGNDYVQKTYHLPLHAHVESEVFLREAMTHATIFGINLKKVTPIKHFLSEGGQIAFGKTILRVLYTPGHAAGSVCFLCAGIQFRYFRGCFVLSKHWPYRSGYGRLRSASGKYLEKTFYLAR